MLSSHERAFGEEGSRPPDLPSFHLPKAQACCQTLIMQKVTAQAALALEFLSPVEKVIQDTDRDTREAWSSV